MTIESSTSSNSAPNSASSSFMAGYNNPECKATLGALSTLSFAAYAATLVLNKDPSTAVAESAAVLGAGALLTALGTTAVAKNWGDSKNTVKNVLENTCCKPSEAKALYEKDLEKGL